MKKISQFYECMEISEVDFEKQKLKDSLMFAESILKDIKKGTSCNFAIDRVTSYFERTREKTKSESSFSRSKKALYIIESKILARENILKESELNFIQSILKQIKYKEISEKQLYVVEQIQNDVIKRFLKTEKDQ